MCLLGRGGLLRRRGRRLVASSKTESLLVRQEDLDDYSSDSVALVLQVDNEDSSAVDSVKNFFLS